MNNLRGRDFLGIEDWSKSELDQVLDLATKFKQLGTASRSLQILKGKTLLLLFFSSSTRTRISFTAAMHQLGGFVQCPDPSGLRLSLEEKPGMGEPIKDTARVVERYVDAIGIRMAGQITEGTEAPRAGLGEAIIRKFAEYSKVPIISLSTDWHHPTQALADIMVIKESLGDPKRKKLVLMWTYSSILRRPQRQRRSAVIAATYGMDVTLVSPEGYDLDPEVTSLAQKRCTEAGRKLEVSHDLKRSLEGAAVVFPSQWCSPRRYTNTVEEELRLAAQHKDWRLTKSLLGLTNNARFINSMPFDRGNDVDDDVADGPNSLIYDEAENLLHVRKAVLALLLADNAALGDMEVP